MARIDRIVLRQQGSPPPRRKRRKIIHARGSYRVITFELPRPHKPAGDWWRTHYADLVERRARGYATNGVAS